MSYPVGSRSLRPTPLGGRDGRLRRESVLFVVHLSCVLTPNLLAYRLLAPCRLISFSAGITYSILTDFQIRRVVISSYMQHSFFAGCSSLLCSVMRFEIRLPLKQSAAIPKKASYRSFFDISQICGD